MVEFICSGIRTAFWSGSVPGDLSVDPQRNVIGHPGAGLIVVDAPEAPARSITLRAIGAREDDPIDLFQPLVLPFTP